MTGYTKPGLTILATATGLGLLGAGLLQQGPIGLSGFLWIGALALGLLVAARFGGLPLTGMGRWFLVPAVLFTGAAVWRGSELLMALDFLALCAAMVLTIRGARGANVAEGGIFQYAMGAALAGFQTFLGPFFLLLTDIKWGELPRGKWSERGAAIARGLLIALPLLLIFGGLFVAADAVFAQMTDRVVTEGLVNNVGHVFRALLWGGLAAGFLRATLLATEPALPDARRPASLSFGAIETGVILGLLNALFLTFVVIQFRYFFGGAALVEATTGLTFAEYARKGFFELVGVAALVLPLLLGLHWLQPPAEAEGGGSSRRLFRALAGALSAQLAVIMASAWQRMMLYQREYGLTEQRLFATAIMIWLAILILWFLVTVIRERRDRFVIGAVLSGFVMLAALHLTN
ncbi:MAG: hypothetical protein K0R39_4869, partial [Symbiobacteriaceae bacterium]|nr:hypothetical protein [Symbiobacteriaceae bacterium]